MPLLGWVGFVVAYVALDWVSFIHSLNGLNITPWNPALALGLSAWLAFGPITAIPWFLAIIGGEWVVRLLPAPPGATLINSILLVVGYGAIAEIIRRVVTVPERLFADQSHLLGWLVVSFVGSLATSAAYVVALNAEGLIAADQRFPSFLQFWVGDVVGITATMPFFWALLFARDRLLAIFRDPVTPLIGMLSAIILAATFILGLNGQFQYFYLLFVPLAWAASRGGIPGAALAAFVLQVGVIVAIRALDVIPITALELQLLAAALAAVSLFVGILVDQRQRAAAELQQSLKLAAAGEMAAALSHELNQPLTALSTYGTAIEQMLDGDEDTERLRSTIRAMVRESHHAADVVRRLRDFFRVGATQLEPIRLSEIVQIAPSLEARAQQIGVELSVNSEGEQRVLADRVQLEVVLRNLVLNALDAVATQESGERRVEVSATEEPLGWAVITVEDSGKGVAPGALAGLFEPFHTTKASGMGLGLAISRAIAEAHGGSLTARLEGHGSFELRLPIERNSDAR